MKSLPLFLLFPSVICGDVVISEISGASVDRLLKYSDSGQPSLGAGVPWFSPSFNDTGWFSGPAPFGFGYGRVSTELGSALQGKTPSLYLRKTFTASASQAASLADLIFTTEFDDGVIVLINGREAARCNLGAPGMFIYSDQVAFNEDSTEGNPVELNLGRASDLLLEGVNTIAVQVVNQNPASSLFFGGSLRIDAGITLLNVVTEDFSNANGAYITHQNTGGSIANITTGTLVSEGWLDQSPFVHSGGSWTDFEVRSLSDPGAGQEGDGAISYTLTGQGAEDEAALLFPSVDMSAHWTPGSVTAANLSETQISFLYQGDPGVAFDFIAESPDGAITASGFPMVAASSDETLGYWRFDDGGASHRAIISVANDSSGNGFTATASGSGGGTYSDDIPGAIIFDPLANAVRSNRFSMDVSASNRRVSVPNNVAFNTSFTIEMFIKIDGEPSGYNAFLRRTAASNSRWQIDFDHAATGAFGRIRSRLDTPDGDNTNFVLGPTGGGSIPSEQRIWVDTDSGNGLVSGYNDPSDWSRDGNGVNDRPGWHHVALSLDEETGIAKFYFDYELMQTRTLVDTDNSGYVHPSSVIEFGKFGGSYGVLIDEVRYTGRTLEEGEFLQVVDDDPGVWATYVVDLAQGDIAERTALLNYLNANNLTTFTPGLKVRGESYSATGKTVSLDSFQVDYARGGASASLVESASDWLYRTGLGEPSGGVFEPAAPIEEMRAEFVDWIELSNSGASTVDLTGWSLTDDQGDLRKWTFPSGTTIPAGGHLLVLADDLDTTGFTPVYLHANFKLNAKGEYLALVDDAGVLRTEFAGGFPRQLDFYSLGLPSGGGEYAYLSEPTPGRANGGPAFSGVVEKPDFDTPAGFHAGSVTLGITTETPGATIRYTTDGTEPTLENGTDYVAPLLLSQINSRTAHSIRARAFLEGAISSKTKSGSFLIGQSSNITSAPALLFAADTERSFTKPYGVLSIEGGRYVDSFWEAADKGDYNMARERGRAFERPAFVEFYAANSTLGFREDAGLRLAASNFSRPRITFNGIENSPWATNSRDKPSFNLYFRDEYEDSSVTFPIFGEDYPVGTFEQLRPRAGKNDINNPHIKDEVMRRLFIDMGNVGSRGIFNSLYLNGEWKGFYNTCERLREPFFQAHYPGSGQWDIRQAGNENGGLAEGDNDAWDELNIRLQASNVNSRSNWESALELVDPVAMADYFLLNIYGATWDWPNNNWVSARERSADGRYRFYVWDAEGAFGHPRRTGNSNSTKPVNYNTITQDLLARTDSTSQMFQRLQRWPEFRLIMADRIHKHFFNGGTLDDSSPNDSKIKEVIDTAISEFSPLLDERSSESVDTEFWRYWTASGSSRRSYLLGPNDEHFRDAGYWPNTGPPAYNQNGGEVFIGFRVTMSGGSGTIYYTLDGSDPRDFGNAVAAPALAYSAPVSLPQSVVTVRSRLRSPGGEWSALTEAEFKVGLIQPDSSNLVVSEIHYHPASPNAAEIAAGFSDPDEFEFIELRNIGNQTLDLTDLSFADGISFNFSDGLVTSLAPGAPVILVQSLDAFRQRYGSGFDALLAGQFGGALSNGGEQIVVETSAGVVRGFSYDDSEPWPACADGDGISLVLLDPSSNPDHSLAASWTGSAQVGGLPGGQPRPFTYAEWQSYLFGPGQASGPSDDPDGDGLSNFIEFFLGSLPGKNDAASHGPRAFVTEVNGEDHLTFSFSQVTGQSSATGLVEVSPSLAGWSSDSADIEEILPSVSNGNGSVTRTFRVPTPISENLRHFLRLRVLEN
ncbi:lamin tail domain-containing protein [Akkermansiaceae bacterium]|nr:lamin tail domain-containing protein [bacterium]MDA7907780.1 lamin tail domain-containing protein [Akkermansiaceae bacterium]MDA7929587.1 lamin tail domain-containing protein [Akkermansiaceae bacterium]MDA7934443.1 lamin tail domain-containing protein [Akkermansiaceae bacterium]